MALTVTAAGDANKTTLPTQRLNVRRAAIPHRRTDATDELIDKIAELPFMWHAPLNTPRHQLRDILNFVAEVAFVPLPQCAKRTHAPVHLIGAPLIDDSRTGTLICASEQTANHHRTRSCTDSLRDIPRIADAAIGDNRDVVSVRLHRAVINGRYLRNADTRNDASRAN